MPSDLSLPRTRPSRSARRLAPVANLGLTAAAAVACWIAVPGATTGATAPQAGAAGAWSSGRPHHVQRLLDAHDCSATGFDDDLVPGSAVVRTAAGRLRHVSFDAGWRVYTRHGAAELLALCRDPAPVS